MIGFIISTLVTAGAFLLGAYLLPGVRIKDFTAAIIVAVIVSLLNATLGALLETLTLGLLGWGVLSFILSALIIRIADYFLDDFKTDSFLWALILAVLIAAVNMVAGSILPI